MTRPEFYTECAQNIARMNRDANVRAASLQWLLATQQYKYSYNFQWLGRPIIQLPADIVALQELIWEVKPDVIVETGIAHGGATILYASILELLGGDRIVIAVDVDIRDHNRNSIEQHPLAKRVRLLEGSSIDSSVLNQVKALAGSRRRTLVILDSNHSHDHVLGELRMYTPMVPAGSYVVVLDTIIEDFPQGSFPGRPWDKGDNPKTAVWAFLRESDRFEIDKERESKLLLTVAPDGYLRCIR
jgi:cephalosporin hydroxylase